MGERLGAGALLQRALSTPFQQVSQVTTCIRLILGDQLNIRHSWFDEVDRDVLYVLMEVRSETDYVRHHAQKVIGLFAAMRHFSEALARGGHRVEYIRIGEERNRHSFAANLAWLVNQFNATRLERMEADEWRVDQALGECFAASGLPHAVVSAEHFLLERADAVKRFAKKVPRMEFFYRELRRQHCILVESDGSPRGGEWNYDTLNREKWLGDPPAPAWPWGKRNLHELWTEIKAAGVQTMGEPSADAFGWPLNRNDAKAWLDDFVTHRLKYFGRFQDALSEKSSTLFHAGLSFALNTKMLHPREVIDTAISALERGACDLPAAEGFVRQILGWREYVRGIYWARMPAYGRLNVLGASRTLPGWYWNADTRMACLNAAIRQSLDLGYAHHIQRLMVTGNFALLAGCDPDEVDRWYLGIYIDAFEWVELPNTRGMSQFADGGIVGSKPYAASASYIARQSDHCKSCHYKPARRHGEKACPLNSLYWHFHERHRDILEKNPRLAMSYRNWDRMEASERTATLTQAEHYLANIETL